MRPFFGRRAELQAWGNVLANPVGQGIVVVGHQGMGKTVLLQKMVELTTSHPTLRCGTVRYEVVPSDTFESVASLMLDDAFKAADQTEGSFAPTDHRRGQWKALLGLMPMGEKLYELVSSLRRDPNLNVRVQLLERLQLISKHLPDDGRAVFFIDSEKYLDTASADAWRLLVRDLPAKCKVVFAQRTDGVLAIDATFLSLPNIVRLPDKELRVLEQTHVKEFVWARSSDIAYDIHDVMAAIERFHGHPYAVAAALDLLANKAADPNSLSLDPTPEHIAAVQWRNVCKRGSDAIRLFRAIAVLESPAELDLISEVADIPPETIQSLIADDFLRGLLRDEGSGYVIYHSLLSDHILAESPGNLPVLHERAAEAYRRRLWESESAAIRLPWHLRALLGDAGFIDGLNECAPRLLDRGFYDSFFEMAKVALDEASETSKPRAALLSWVATAKLRRGDLDEAVSLLLVSLEFFERTGDVVGKALQLNKLAEIHEMRGDFEGAEAALREALPIFQAEQFDAGVAQCLNGLAAIDLARGLSHEAVDKHQMAFNAALASGDPSQVAISLSNMAKLHVRRGEYPQAIEKLQNGLKLLDQSGYSEGRAGVLGNLGWIYRQQGKLGEALAVHRQALEIGTKLGHRLRMAEEYASLSEIYLALRDLDQAESMVRSALELEQGLGLDPQVAKRYSALGRIYHARNDFKMAKFMQESALSTFKRTGDLEATATEWANLGATLHSEKNLPEALAAYERALRIAEQIDCASIQAFVLGNIGVLHRQRENWKESSEAHHRARALYERIGNREGIANQNEHLGKLYARLGERTKAIEILEEALAIYGHLGASQRTASVSVILASLRRL